MARLGGWWLGIAASLLAATTAHGAVAWMGLPNGTVAAWSTQGGHVPWVHVTRADVPDVGAYAVPAAADLDGDGDDDVLVGESNGRVLAFENVGSDTAPAWQRRAAWEPDADVGAQAAPALGDIDGDGDDDLLVGNGATGLVALERTADGWAAHPAWAVAVDGVRLRPALGDIDGDGHLDLMVGNQDGALIAFRGTGSASAPFVRQPAWDGPAAGTRVAPALLDLDGDHHVDLVVTDGGARSTAWSRSGDAWTALAGWAPPDPGSGPASIALARGELSTSAPPSGGGAGGTTLAANLVASTRGGPAPLRVTFDASGSTVPTGTTATFAWDFGDGTVIAPAPGDAADAAAVLRRAPSDYAAAKALRDSGRYDDAVAAYRTLGETLLGVVGVHEPGPLSRKGTNDIGRVARWYLQKLAHDVGGTYLWHDVAGTSGCDRYAASLQWSRESAAQAKAGGFPSLPALNGTNGNIGRATKKLQQYKCATPATGSPFGVSALMAADTMSTAVVEHVYSATGTMTARVTVTAGADSRTATVSITVDDPDVASPPPDEPGDGDADVAEGFGAMTPGGDGGRIITVDVPSEDAVRAAIGAANAGHAVIRFTTRTPIVISHTLPQLTGAFITVDGGGATLIGATGANPVLLDVRGHDVIVRDIRLRNGYDNLRVQGPEAHDVVITHVSSTGSKDDGVSIGYGAHDVTLQWSFLAGNTRSIFMKYHETDRVSIHHVRVMKQWVRGPLVSGGIHADIRNLVIEDWTLWGVRFEDGSTGNVVQSLFSLGNVARSLGGKPDSALRMKDAGPVFTAGNVYEGVAVASDQGDATAPMDAPAVTTWPVAEMATKVRARAGCLPRDAVDAAYIARLDGWDVTESTPLRLGAAD